MANEEFSVPPFLSELLAARSPSGYEAEAQAVVDKYMRDVSDVYEKDTIGNRIGILNPDGDPTVLLSGHMDELGLIIRHVDDKGYLFFDCIGGIDLNLLAGRRVNILTRNGVVKGITGKRAIHLLDAEERKKVPKIENLWIDIGARDREDALNKVRIGDAAVIDEDFELFNGSIGTSRAFDNKAGCYVVCEVLRRLAADAQRPAAKVVAVATAQEEIGCRGARAVSNRMPAQFAIAVDVGHATDHPECDNRKFGQFKLGGGPLITRGPNINPIVFDRLIACAEQEKIPVQIEAEARPTGTDGRELQMGGAGVATGVVSVPLRYMHTPSEIVDLMDIENTVRLLTAFVRSLQKGERADW